MENQNQIYTERFKSLFELNQNNSKLNNERIDKLFKIIENLSQNQVNISKSILKLENKFLPDREIIDSFYSSGFVFFNFI
jgi:hypothetical protein